MTIEKNKATLDEDIYLYRLDKNIELYFTIVNNKYRFNKSDMNNIIMMTNAAFFQVRLYKNAEIKYTFAIQPTDGGQAILTITDDLIDDPIEVGDYDFQISLLDEEKTSMISMPIVSKQLHVCEPLVSDDATMGKAILGLSKLATGEIKNAFDSEGNYIREIHKDGDILSASIINKFEDALDSNTKAIKAGTGKAYDDTAIKTDINTIKTDLGTETLTTTAKDVKGAVNEVAAQYKDIAKQKLIKDIQQTDYKIGQSIDYSYLKTNHIKQYRRAMQKIKIEKNATICCIGDSLTYGTDNNSLDKRPPDTILCPDGSSHVESRASTTYPEALQTYLRSVYGNNINVINRGFSGDWIEKGYERWCTKHDGDISIIMYGTNDSNPEASWIPTDIKGNIDKYFEWYEQLIIREILWGKGIIILKSPKLRFANSESIQNFTQSLNLLGEKYGIPVIDGVEFLSNVSAKYYNDGTHLTGDGYKLFGAKVTSLFIGNDITSTKYVNPGDKLLYRTQLDSCTYIGKTVMSQANNSPTVDENKDDYGLCLNLNNDDDKIIYSFYTESDDMIIVPFYWSQNSNIRFTIDFNTINIKPTITNLIDVNLTNEVIHSTKQPTMLDYLNGSTSPIYIAKKGYHTLMIDKTVSGNIVFTGLSFMSYEQFLNKKLLTKLVNVPKILKYSLNDEQSFSFTLDNVIEIYGNLFDKWNPNNNALLKLTIYNYNNSVIEYAVKIAEFGEANYGGSIEFVELTKKMLNKTNESSIGREIDTFNFSKSDAKFTIQWKGDLTIKGNIVIQIL
jgi:lysophospholipase L1-like esterase